jgi:TolA-binding protein
MTNPSDEKKLLDAAMAELRAGNLDEAERRFIEFLERYPSTDLSDNALYNLSKVYMARGDKPKALEQLTILVEKFPDSDACYFAKDERIELLRDMGMGPDETPEERYQSGKEAYGRGDLDEAMEIFKVFIERYPDSGFIDNAHYNLAKIYKKRGDHALVRQHVQIIMEKYPDSDAASYAEELLDED